MPVQAPRPELAVERRNACVVRRPAGPAEVERDAASVGPQAWVARDEFAALPSCVGSTGCTCLYPFAGRPLGDRGIDVPDTLLAHVAPPGWAHIRLTGDCLWTEDRQASQRFRPLRPTGSAACPGRTSGKRCRDGPSPCDPHGHRNPR